jgi:hypothetical protein
VGEALVVVMEEVWTVDHRERHDYPMPMRPSADEPAVLDDIDREIIADLSPTAGSAGWSWAGASACRPTPPVIECGASSGAE